MCFRTTHRLFAQIQLHTVGLRSKLKPQGGVQSAAIYRWILQFFVHLFLSDTIFHSQFALASVRISKFGVH